MRSPSGGKGKPYASCSGSLQPVPIPTSTRPPETWSTVATTLASSDGCRKVAGETSVPRRTVLVTAASAARVAQASSEPRSPRPSTER